MNRALALVLCLALAACAGPRDERLRMVRDVAVPGKVVATELAFARAAREDGQWTAFRAFAADDGVMFVPQPVKARDWTRKQANPPQSVAWQPHQVWMSCDGSLAVTKGAWQRPDGAHGYFTTVWQRQRDGEYRWVLDQGDVLAEPLAEPDMIATEIADCGEVGERVPDPQDDPATGLRAFAGMSRDATLEWSAVVAPGLSRVVEVHIWKDGTKRLALESRVAAPGER